jgi:hypothetical protein
MRIRSAIRGAGTKAWRGASSARAIEARIA